MILPQNLRNEILTKEIAVLAKLVSSEDQLVIGKSEADSSNETSPSKSI